MPLERRKSLGRHDRRRSRSRSRSHERRRKDSDSRRRRSRSGSRHKRPVSPRRKPPRHGSPARHRSPHRRRSMSPKRRSPARRRSVSPKRRRRSSSPSKHESPRQQGQGRGRSSSPSHVTSSQSGKEYRKPSPSRRQSSPDTSRHYLGTSQDAFNPIPDSASSRYPDPSSTNPPYRSRSPISSFLDDKYSQQSSISSLTILNTNVFRQLLNDRFRTTEQEIEGPFKFDDNISIQIHRAPNVRNLPHIPVNHVIDLNKFIMLRKPNEGTTRLFDREEIKIFRHDENLSDDPDYYQERRTISIVPSTKQELNYEDMRISQDVGFLQGFSSTNIRLDINDLDDFRTKDRRRAQDRDRKDSDRDRRRHKGPIVRLDPKPDPRYEALMKAENQRTDNIPRNPNDLRHSLLKRRTDDRDNSFDARKRIEARRKTDEQRSDRDRARSDRPGRDRSPRQRSGARDDAEKGRTKDKEALPDFSRRFNKYKYEEWLDNPEMIPRNPMYFEHDNREDSVSSSFPRGRGRGFRGSRPFRGGGRFRGRWSPRASRGRNYSALNSRSRDSGGGEWKHDLFDKLEKDEDEKPSSTTKN